MYITFADADMHDATPAKCNHDTKVIYRNVNVFYKHSKAARVFILLHEIGHLIQKTHSELNADEWALKQFVNHGYSYAVAYNMLQNTLPGSNSQQIKRINQSKKIVNHLAMENQNYNHISAVVRTPLAPRKLDKNCMCDSFLGFGKVARERRRARVARLKLESESKAEERRLNAQARLELAKQGVSEFADKADRKERKTNNILKGIGGAVNSIMGGGNNGGGNDDGGGGQSMAMNQAPPPEVKKTFGEKYGIKLGIAAAGLALVIGAYMVIKKHHH